jgi:hypothetical protein
MATLEQKVKISLGSAGLFFLLNSPNSYKFVSNILNMKLIENNCPNHLGIFVNTLLFFIFTYISMGDPFKDSLFKLKNTTYGSLIYFLISSPTIYYLTSKILKFNECRNTVSLLIHSAIYFIILVGVMYFPE